MPYQLYLTNSSHDEQANTTGLSPQPWIDQVEQSVAERVSKDFDAAQRCPVLGLAKDATDIGIEPRRHERGFPNSGRERSGALRARAKPADFSDFCRDFAGFWLFQGCNFRNVVFNHPVNAGTQRYDGGRFVVISRITPQGGC
jgi:hypothetical protein